MSRQSKKNLVLPFLLLSVGLMTITLTGLGLIKGPTDSSPGEYGAIVTEHANFSYTIIDGSQGLQDFEPAAGKSQKYIYLFEDTLNIVD